MMTVQEMKARKIILGLTNEMLARESGLPLGTVQKVLAGITKAPRRETLLKLERVLADREEAPDDRKEYPAFQGRDQADRSGTAARETPLSYGSGKRLYTIADYYALPDDRRTELIDGVFYDMSSPGLAHQAILAQLFLLLAPCVEEHPECELFFAPSDVRLDNDDYTMVQPDLYIVCRREDEDKRRLNGAPDFVIEILSPSNRDHDMFRKLKKYRYAGVREYWIVDPVKEKVIVYVLENDDFPALYTFHDTIPVGISGGSCSVDFEKILQKVQRYL